MSHGESIIRARILVEQTSEIEAEEDRGTKEKENMG
jgi:hypothetical protein